MSNTRAGFDAEDSRSTHALRGRVSLVMSTSDFIKTTFLVNVGRELVGKYTGNLEINLVFPSHNLMSRTV